MIKVRNTIDSETLGSFLNYKTAISMFPDYHLAISVDEEGSDLENPEYIPVSFIPEDEKQRLYLIQLDHLPSTDLDTSKAWAFGKIKARHSTGLLTLAESPTLAEIATFPRKTYYVDKLRAGALTEDDRVMLSQALSGDDTVDKYLGRTAKRIHGYDQMWTFAEGFKGRGYEAVSQAMQAEDWKSVLEQTMTGIMQAADAAEAKFAEAMKKSREAEATA